MFVKRILLSAAAAVCAVSLLVPAAFAHGGCHGRRAVQQTAQPCHVEDCTLTGWHYHSRTLYCGHTHNGSGLCDGSCYALCPVEGCAVVGRHVHDGVTYCGYHHEEGYCDGSCYALCPVEGCAVAGRHTHNGTTYCGANHACGYCDGTCPYYNQAPASSGVRYGGRHGCHR